MSTANSNGVRGNHSKVKAAVKDNGVARQYNFAPESELGNWCIGLHTVYI